MRPLLTLAGAVTLLLVAFAGGYGYHRDELYFLAAGEHLAWAYPDQGPVIPLLAHAMHAIAPDSLTVLRIPSALMAGGTVLVSGLICHEFGGTRRAQLLAGGCTAVASIVLVTGHLLSTSTLDLLAWSTLDVAVGPGDPHRTPAPVGCCRRRRRDRPAQQAAHRISRLRPRHRSSARRPASDPASDAGRG